jgi:uncharacterized membrane protein HdeD (DUF308 family)
LPYLVIFVGVVFGPFKTAGRRIVMIVVGLILIVVGILALLIKLGILSGSLWSYTWPAILIILGVSFILGRFWRRGQGWRGWYFPGRREGKQ